MTHLSKYLAAYARHLRGSRAFGHDYSCEAEQERGHLLRPDPRPSLAHGAPCAAQSASALWAKRVR